MALAISAAGQPWLCPSASFLVVQAPPCPGTLQQPPLASGRPPLRSWSGKGNLKFCVRTAEAVATAEASIALVQPMGAGRGCAWHLRAVLLGNGLLAALLQLLGAVLLSRIGCTLAPGWRSIQVQRPKCCRHHRAGLGATQRCGWPVLHGLPQGNVWLPHPLPCTLPSKALGGPGGRNCVGSSCRVVFSL